MDWKARMRAAGLRQSVIVQLLGRHKATVSQDLAHDHPPPAVRAIIAAWEIMTPAQRQAWLAAIGAG